MTQKGEDAAKNVTSLTQVLLYTFSCNSIFPSWLFIKTRQYYNEQQKHIQKPISVSEITI